MAWWRAGTFFDKALIRYQRGSMNQHYKSVFDSLSGRIVLADLMNEGGLLATAEGLPMEQVMFHAGKRHMATHILARLNFVESQVQQIAHLTSEEPDNG